MTLTNITDESCLLITTSCQQKLNRKRTCISHVGSLQGYISNMLHDKRRSAETMGISQKENSSKKNKIISKRKFSYLQRSCCMLQGDQPTPWKNNCKGKKFKKTTENQHYFYWKFSYLQMTLLPRESNASLLSQPKKMHLLNFQVC